MARITIKYSPIGTVEIKVDEGETFSSLLKKCETTFQEDLSNIIGVKNGQVVKHDDLISDSDDIVIFPALSGG